MVFAHVASLLLMLALALFTNVAEATRIKDLASIQGVRENYLVGYGLVVGLDGTGDSADFTGQSLRSLLSHYGIKLPPNVNPKSQNVAAVMVHANLPPFIKQGQTVDITVSALGSSKSLRGGSLLMTPLKGIDGQIYAIAQGNLIVGGFGAEGADGSRVTVNVPSTGRVPNGAIVEREVSSPFALGETLTLNLHTPDFTTARRMAEVINETLGPDTATASDAVSVSVLAPKDANQRVSFMSFLENLTFEPGEPAAKIIVNARTGTIVIGNHVEVLPAAVTHGSLVVTIAAKQEVSQPEPFTDGETTVTTQTDIQVSQSSGPMFLFEPGVQLQDIVRAVNQVGAAPGDLIAILEALRGAGALRAELIVI
jgi:flagellar P-ring protein precursor FlgI